MLTNEMPHNTISKIPVELTKYLRSTSSISTIAQCTEELVHNALDSGSSCIAIRVDMSQLKVQVIDNGDGISKNDMERVCSRFMTSKCHSLKDLEQGGLCKYGYRGEALANIREMSSILQIVSRKRQEKETWTVLFSRGKRKPVKLFYETRQCSGTTVTVVDFMYNLPVRRRMINPTLELHDMLQSVIGICLVNPDTSFTFLNENTGKKLLQTLKQNSSKQLFPLIFGKVWKDALLEIKKVSDKLSLHGFIGKKGVMNSDKQFIYVNRRPIRSTKLLKIVTSQLKKSIICRQPPTNENKQRAAQNYHNSPFKYAKLYPIFCIEIELPFFDYDISFGPRKNEVEFQDWEYVTKFIICSVNEFLVANNLLPPSANMLEKERQKRDNEKVAYLPAENVDKFSMTGIEPLNTTMETQQSSVPEAMSNENSLIRTDFTAKLSEKVDKSKRTIGASEIDGARQCRPVFKPQKRSPGKMLSESKIIQSALPYSSTPNPSLQYPKNESKITSFFKAGKNNYFVDEKGLFKKSGKKNIARSINFKAMNKKPTPGKNISSPHNTSSANIKTKISVTGSNIDSRRQTLSLAYDVSGHGYDSICSPPLKSMAITRNPETFCPLTFDIYSDSEYSSNIVSRESSEHSGISAGNAQEYVNQTQHSSSGYSSHHSYGCFSLMGSNKGSSIDLERGNHFLPSGNHINDLVNDPYVDATLSRGPETNFNDSYGCYFALDSHKGSGADLDRGSIFLPSGNLINDFVNDTHVNANLTREPEINLNDSYGCFSVIDSIKGNSTDLDKENDFLHSENNINDLGNYTHVDANLTREPEINLNGSYGCFSVIDSIKGSSIDLDKESYVLPSENYINDSVKDTHVNADLTQEPEINSNDTLGCFSLIDSNQGSSTGLRNGGYFLPSETHINDLVNDPRGSANLTGEPEINFNDNSKWNEESLSSFQEAMTSSKSNINNFLTAWENPMFACLPRLFASTDCTRKLKKIRSDAYRFQPDLFDRIRVVGQVDKKFIAAIGKDVSLAIASEQPTTTNLLLLFDQHAVHERIRLETLIIDHFARSNQVLSSKLGIPLEMSLSYCEMEILSDHIVKFQCFGLQIESISNTEMINGDNNQNNDQLFKVTHVPTCFVLREENKKKHNQGFSMHKIITVLVHEIIDIIKTTHGGGLAILPKSIIDTLSSMACRGAVKFGDALSTEQCKSLVIDLKNCDAPFQCAHGRPSLVPIVGLDKLRKCMKASEKGTKIHLRRLTQL